jgi:hypothetical protein
VPSVASLIESSTPRCMQYTLHLSKQHHVRPFVPPPPACSRCLCCLRCATPLSNSHTRVYCTATHAAWSYIDVLFNTGTEALDPATGRIYYYNKTSRETTWYDTTRPNSTQLDPARPSSTQPLPLDCTIRQLSSLNGNGTTSKCMCLGPCSISTQINSHRPPFPFPPACPPSSPILSCHHH